MAKWVAPWTPGLEQKRCPTCKPYKGRQPLVVACTMIDGVCVQCARSPRAPVSEPEQATPEPQGALW